MLKATATFVSVLVSTLRVTVTSRSVFDGPCERSSTTASGTHAPRGQICSGDLIFFDDFRKFDLSVWSHEKTMAGGWNGEFQMYLNKRSSSFVRDGTLHIKPILTIPEGTDDKFLYSGTVNLHGENPTDECTNEGADGCIRTGSSDRIINPIRSAKIRTVNSFHFKFGKVEVRAKLPTGDWLWPAIWLMPRYNQYSTWPSSGEIDLIESRGNRHLKDNNGQPLGIRKTSSTLHWGPSTKVDKYRLTHYPKAFKRGLDEEFHLYQMVWTEDGFVFAIDGKIIGEVAVGTGGFWELGDLESSGYDNPWAAGTKMAPFDEEFYIIMNLAVGGSSGYFPDNAKNRGGKPWKNHSSRAVTDFWKGKDQWLPTWKENNDSSSLKVDYVRVWAL